MNSGASEGGCYELGNEGHWLLELANRLQASVLEPFEAERMEKVLSVALRESSAPESLVLRSLLAEYVAKYNATSIGRLPDALKQTLLITTALPRAEFVVRAFLDTMTTMSQSYAVQVATGGDARVTTTQAIIERLYHDPHLRLADVAKEQGISPSHLTHLLKLKTGSTFATLLRKRRIEGAKRLLEDTDLRIKQVAGDVGYTWPSLFVSHFHQMVGTTPGTYRTGRRALAVPHQIN